MLLLLKYLMAILFSDEFDAFACTGRYGNYLQFSHLDFSQARQSSRNHLVVDILWMLGLDKEVPAFG